VRHYKVTRFFRIITTTISLYLVTHIFVFTVLPFAILLCYLDPERIPAIKQWFVKCIFAIVGIRLKVSGHNNYSLERRYVIVSNYPSGYAGFAMIGEFPHASLVAHAFLRSVPILGQALRMIGAVFVLPGSAGRGRKAFDLYLGGHGDVPSIIILPEGRITRDAGIHRFRRGFVRIQRHTDFDVLPVTLNELFRFKPFGRLHADPDAKPEMVIHPAIKAASENLMSDEELISLVRETVENSYRP
jgi:1-acyl-sn-glycerol-3-phosphate acyltransferase